MSQTSPKWSNQPVLDIGAFHCPIRLAAAIVEVETSIILTSVARLRVELSTLTTKARRAGTMSRSKVKTDVSLGITTQEDELPIRTDAHKTQGGLGKV